MAPTFQEISDPTFVTPFTASSRSQPAPVCWIMVAAPATFVFQPFHPAPQSALSREVRMIKPLCCSKPSLALQFSPRKVQVLTVAHQAIHGQSHCPFAHSADQLLRHTPASGPSLWLFPLPGRFFPQKSTWLTFFQIVAKNITFSKRPTLATLFNTEVGPMLLPTTPDALLYSTCSF